MKSKLFITLISAAILLAASLAWAVPGAVVVYEEQDLGGGFWQYNYTLYNTSTGGEALHEINFYFPQAAGVTGTSLPAGWNGLPWSGSTTVSLINAYSTEFPYDISARDSLAGFSFTVDFQAGGISYDAFFSGDNIISGTTADCQLVPVYRDNDSDGFGDPAIYFQQCSAPASYVADNTDCDDSLASINPLTLWFRDNDGDGYGDVTSYLQQCTAPAGYVLDYTDCDDSSAALNPDTLWHPDVDGDGYGNASISVQQCEQPGGPFAYVLNVLDYDDNDSAVGPPAMINGGTTSYYVSLQEAYDLAGDGDTIHCVNVVFAEDLIIDADKSVTMQGGYDGSYSEATGDSVLEGDVNVTGGTLIFENFELRQQ